jgi:hypothetical protein
MKAELHIAQLEPADLRKKNFFKNETMSSCLINPKLAA